jgi:aryl-alcohol dehydrogenase-like predicted oxidoreductase
LPLISTKSTLAYLETLCNATLLLYVLTIAEYYTGSKWKGKCSKETTFSILDYFYSPGGNFIDMACNYQNEQPEMWIGEWMTAHQNRDQIVLATKFSTNFQFYKGQGNHIT